jgi:hypothetical protein
MFQTFVKLKNRTVSGVVAAKIPTNDRSLKNEAVIGPAGLWTNNALWLLDGD